MFLVCFILVIFEDGHKQLMDVVEVDFISFDATKCMEILSQRFKVT